MMTTTIQLHFVALLIVLLSSMLAHRACCESHQHHYHTHASKMRHHLQIFEGDIAPEYYEVLDTYGTNVTEELVSLGVFSVPKNTDRRETPAAGSREYFRIWSENRLDDVTVIPYEFVEDGAFTDTERSMMIQAMDHVSRQLNIIQFVSRKIPSTPKHLPYLRFTDDRVRRTNPATSGYPSCFSYVGWQGGQHQPINLAKDSVGCFYFGQGLLEHWLLHTLGLWHTQSRYDRDQYVTIAWENVAPGLEHDLRKKALDDTLGLPYDYDSLMHDAHDDFSGNGNDTIVAPVPVGLLIGMSPSDVILINLLYQCRSGPRKYEEYITQPCTEDCPCWEDEMANDYEETRKTQVVTIPPKKCLGSDSLCRGDLICSSQTDRCIRADINVNKIYPGTKKSLLPRPKTFSFFLVNPAHLGALLSRMVPSIAVLSLGCVLLLYLVKAGKSWARALQKNRMQYAALT